MELYQSYSELTTILYSFDLYLYENDTKQLMIEIIKKREEFLKNWLNKYPIEACNLQPNYLAMVINDLMKQCSHTRYFSCELEHDSVTVVHRYLQ